MSYWGTDVACLLDPRACGSVYDYLLSSSGAVIEVAPDASSDSGVASGAGGNISLNGWRFIIRLEKITSESASWSAASIGSIRGEVPLSSTEPFASPVMISEAVKLRQEGLFHGS